MEKRPIARRSLEDVQKDVILVLGRADEIQKNLDDTKTQALAVVKTERKKRLLKKKALQTFRFRSGLCSMIAVAPMILICVLIPPYSHLEIWGLFALTAVYSSGRTMYLASRKLRKLEISGDFK